MTPNWTKEPWAYNATLVQMTDSSGSWIRGTDENRQRIVQCVNACAGVEQLGSVRDLINALIDASEVVRDRLRMAEAAGNKKETKWASEILADAQAALAKFRLEPDHASK